MISSIDVLLSAHSPGESRGYVQETILVYLVPGYDSLQLRMSFMRLHGDFFDEAGEQIGISSLLPFLQECGHLHCQQHRI